MKTGAGENYTTTSTIATTKRLCTGEMGKTGECEQLRPDKLRLFYGKWKDHWQSHGTRTCNTTLERKSRILVISGGEQERPNTIRRGKITLKCGFGHSGTRYTKKKFHEIEKTEEFSSNDGHTVMIIRRSANQLNVAPVQQIKDRL